MRIPIQPSWWEVMVGMRTGMKAVKPARGGELSVGTWDTSQECALKIRVPGSAICRPQRRQGCCHPPAMPEQTEIA